MRLSPKALQSARHHGLTCKQAHFWLFFMTGHNGSESARMAGYSAAGGGDGQRASELVHNSKKEFQASEWLAELAGDAEAAKSLTAEHVLAMLMREAKNCQTDGARIRAQELLGKAREAFVDTLKIETDADQVMTALKSILPPSEAQALADQLGVTVVTEPEE